MAINDVIAHLDPDQGEGLEGYITAEDVKASLYDLYNLIITTISEGPIGPQGIQGPLGPQGIAGPVGPTGPAPTFDVGTVETGTADVSLSGNPSTGYYLNLVLPTAGADGVNTAAIQNGAVTTEKIANGTIVNADVNAAADIGRSKIAGTALTTTSTGVFSVLDYGAVGDGSTDDTDAIEACIAAAAAAGHGQVYFPETTGGYKTTDTITFDNDADVDMCGFIKYAGPDGRAAIVVGSTSAITWKRNLKLEAVRAVQADWTSEADIGIKLLNVDGSTINIVRTQGFTIGAQLVADGNYGTVYNLVTLGKMWYAKVGLDLYSVNGGWTNENLFLGGSFSVWGGLYVGAESKSRYGIRLRNGGAYGANNNVFHKPSFEIAGPGLVAPAEGVPILLEDDSFLNTFHDVRDEATGTYVARVSDSAKRNKIILGYGQGLVDEQAAQASTVLEQTDWAPESSRQVIFHMPDIHKRAAAWHPNESWHLCNVPGMFGIKASSGAIQPYTGGVMHDDYFDLESEGSLGVTVDTRLVKEFLVTASTDPDHPCSLKCRPKDSSGNVIDAADVKYGGDPLIRSSAGTWWATNFGGTYTGSVGNTVRFTVCHDDVASVDVFATTGWITSFEISAYSPKGLLTSASTPYPDNVVENVASTAPAFGTYTVGRRVYNNTPAAGQPMGWMCTVAGTPGTWKAMANLA